MKRLLVSILFSACCLILCSEAYNSSLTEDYQEASQVSASAPSLSWDGKFYRLYNSSRDIELKVLMSKEVYVLVFLAKTGCPLCINATKALDMLCSYNSLERYEGDQVGKSNGSFSVDDTLEGRVKCAVTDIRGTRRLAPELLIGKPVPGVPYLAGKIELPKFLIVDDWTRVPKRPDLNIHRQTQPEEIAKNMTEVLRTALKDNVIDPSGFYRKSLDVDNVEMFGQQKYMNDISKEMADEMHRHWRSDREATATVWAKGAVEEDDGSVSEEEALRKADELSRELEKNVKSKSKRRLKTKKRKLN